MGKSISMFCLAALSIISVLFQNSVAQTTHTVGDSTGWLIPSGGASTYATWASQQTFVVGDTLVFNFVAGSHDVTEVTNASFTSCSATNPISTNAASPARITLSTAGERYFICSFSGHCSAGQKLAVNVSSASTATPPTSTTSSPPPPSTTTTTSSPPPPSTTTTTTTSPPPPPPSSASSLPAMTLPVALFSFVLAFFY